MKESRLFQSAILMIAFCVVISYYSSSILRVYQNVNRMISEETRNMADEQESQEYQQKVSGYAISKGFYDARTAEGFNAYYLTLKGQVITIYKEVFEWQDNFQRDQETFQVILYDGSQHYFQLYDYAALTVESIPQDIAQTMTRGIYIEGEENLYDFLQTYSS